MAVEVVTGSPLAKALQNVILPKITECGWTTGSTDSDSSLVEYIVLMLVNKTTEEQIASELANDLLGLGPDDQQTTMGFARWLFEQVETLNAQINGTSTDAMDAADDAAQHDPNGNVPVDSVEQDAVMADDIDGSGANIPTGPKAMRSGPRAQPQSREKRMGNQMQKHMDRSGESQLHRVKGGKINSHARDPPKGPRSSLGRNISMLNGNGMGNGMSGPFPQPGSNMFQPQQQQPMGGMAGMANMANMAGMPPAMSMEFFKHLEMQSQLMANLIGQQQQQNPTPIVNPNFRPKNQNNRAAGRGKNLLDRVEGREQSNGKLRGNRRQQPQQDSTMSGSDANDADGEASKMEVESKEPFDVMCKFNTTCTKLDCPFAHSTPASTTPNVVDLSQTCSYGVACKNIKCTGRHPSPYKKILHQKSKTQCSFFPHCTNENCPYMHPPMPLCRNYPNCETPNCKFSHDATNVPKCRHNPCRNAKCPYQHEEGQQREMWNGGALSNVWTPNTEKKDHVSERVFVANEGEEELILAGSGGQEETQKAQNGDPETQVMTG
ncbi:hypothetical protein K402DRAFT_395791 [Aulographum hederae CBS 113979]|uniref:Nab2-like CCCH zinc finger domain-containing protein n=1 Tax=Aulographum hederae CBS 113979 TaxID=1176131 RepID=A0A6G1GUI1_9PEZI|nr:hypothetical protein K402DRAFT_395791 [Aulographum hederae CBS 113979]